jgi:hypothetical protein
MKGKHRHKWDYLRQVLSERIVYDDNRQRVWFFDHMATKGLLYSCRQAQVGGQAAPAAAAAAAAAELCAPCAAVLQCCSALTRCNLSLLCVMCVCRGCTSAAALPLRPLPRHVCCGFA